MTAQLPPVVAPELTRSAGGVTIATGGLMAEEDELEARLSALEQEVAQERTAAELEALEKLREEQRELDELRGRLSRLQREHREALREVFGDPLAQDLSEGVGDRAPAPAPRPSGGVSVELSPELHARLDQLAGERGESVQALCEGVLDGYMRSRLARPVGPEAAAESPGEEASAEAEPPAEG